MRFEEKELLSLDSSGFHRIIYSDWGPQDGRIVLCVHSLTGNGSDFEYLARELVQDGYRVIAPDLPGRGRSDFLANPLDYNLAQYCVDLAALLAHLQIQRPIDWIGNSLGGLLGIRLAGVPFSPIGRLILNDIGPTAPKAALDFIFQVVSQHYRFATVKDLENRMRETRGLTYGPITDEQWHHMAEHSARPLEDGSITYGYDQRISVMFGQAPAGETDLWMAWDQIRCPTLILQGGKSMILPNDVVAEMQSRGPRSDLYVFPDCGHIPSLMAPEQIAVVRRWLNK
jgi:pimeloyl-ACP methyl ester carboxylesterase